MECERIKRFATDTFVRRVHYILDFHCNSNIVERRRLADNLSRGFSMEKKKTIWRRGTWSRLDNVFVCHELSYVIGILFYRNPFHRFFFLCKHHVDIQNVVIITYFQGNVVSCIFYSTGNRSILSIASTLKMLITFIHNRLRFRLGSSYLEYFLFQWIRMIFISHETSQCSRIIRHNDICLQNGSTGHKFTTNISWRRRSPVQKMSPSSQFRIITVVSTILEYGVSLPVLRVLSNPSYPLPCPRKIIVEIILRWVTIDIISNVEQKFICF